MQERSQKAPRAAVEDRATNDSHAGTSRVSTGWTKNHAGGAGVEEGGDSALKHIL